MSIFCERMAHGAPVEVFGDGGQTRDFIFVADVVAVLLAAMQRPALDAPVYNVCTGIPNTVLALAQTIAELTGTTADIRHAPPRAGEIRHSTGVPDRARAAFGLAPPVRLRDGLRQVLDWVAGTR